MTSRVRSALGRFLTRGLAVLALLMFARTLVAQEVSGKIEGTVSDQAGVALANAQVLIVGTSYGAITNDQGYYFINNVPIGTYTVRAQFIGYAPSEVRGVRVPGGQTVTINITMQTSAIEVTGITITAAANPIVPRDQVASKTIIAGELVGKLPVSDVRQVLGFTPGVVESGAGDGVSIRGGRPGEANVYIDGAPVRGANSGGQRITIGTNALEEASVTTGALGVEFADAQSGVIAYTTRAGGANIHGSLSYETDEPFGNSISVGYNRVEGALGGPIPGLQNLTWFLSGVLNGQQSDFRGKGSEDVARYVTGGVDQVVTDTASDGAVTTRILPQFVQYSGQCDAAANYGFECQGRRFPMDWTSALQFQAKLQYTYGSGSSVSLTGVSNDNKTRNTPGAIISNPERFTGGHNWQKLLVLNWSHQVFRSAERALSVNANLSYGRDQGITGALSPATEIDSRNPSMGLYFGSMEFEGYEGFPIPIGDRVIRNIRTNNCTPPAGQCVPLLDRNDLRNSQGGLRTNPFGMQGGGWTVNGFDVAGTLLDEKRYNGRLVVDWQANRFHRFTLGGDAKKVDLSYWSSALLRQAFMDAYVSKPEQYGLFASDRLDLGDIVLELGVRWDYYNSKALFPTTPGRTFTNPRFQTDYADAATDDATYAAYLADTEIWTPSVGHTAISPRLRVSFPVTEQTGFRLSYSHQVNTPEFTTLLTGVNNDFSFTNSNDVFGQDLDFGKSILFEFGVRHAFTPDVVLDVSAYNKDKVSDYAARILPYVDPRSPTDTLNANVLTNLDFGNSKGLDVKFDWRIGSVLSTSVAYTYQVARGTGSDPFTYLNTFARATSGILGDRQLPPEQAQRTDNDRTHNVVGAVAVTFPNDFGGGSTFGQILRNVSAFATFRLQSGLPYTRLINAGDGQTAPFLAVGLGGRAAEPLNASVLPWNYNVDLRVNKGLRFGAMDITAYVDVRNLLNTGNTEGVFAETGGVVNTKHRDDVFVNPELAGLANEAQLAGALATDGSTINLNQNCQTWTTPINCESLRRVEARFGDGDGAYTRLEQLYALNAAYNSFWGAWGFYSNPRHIRLGLELNF